MAVQKDPGDECGCTKCEPKPGCSTWELVQERLKKKLDKQKEKK